MPYKSNLASILNNIEREVKSEIRVQAAAIQTEAESLIREPKSGRVYMHPQPAPHTSSAPGEPWANWTGATAATFETSTKDGGFTGVFSSGGNSWHLEYGTQSISPRPLHRPVLANRRQPIINGLAAALRAGTRF